jgi:hypothetical protein
MRFIFLCLVCLAAGCSSSSTGSQVVPTTQVESTAGPQSTWAPSSAAAPKFTDAEVVGIVRYKGQPLPGATVLFHSGDGSSGTESLADGTYRLTAKPGTYKVTVATNMDRDPLGKKSKVFVAIPIRYSQIDTTDLQFDLVVGPNNVDINLR